MPPRTEPATLCGVEGYAIVDDTSQRIAFCLDRVLADNLVEGYELRRVLSNKRMESLYSLICVLTSEEIPDLVELSREDLLELLTKTIEDLGEQLSELNVKDNVKGVEDFFGVVSRRPPATNKNSPQSSDEVGVKEDEGESSSNEKEGSGEDSGG